MKVVVIPNLPHEQHQSNQTPPYHLSSLALDCREMEMDSKGLKGIIFKGLMDQETPDEQLNRPWKIHKLRISFEGEANSSFGNEKLNVNETSPRTLSNRSSSEKSNELQMGIRETAYPGEQGSKCLKYHHKTEKSEVMGLKNKIKPIINME